LAGARASTIVRYLIKAHKVDPKRLVSISYADQRPIASNENEEGRVQNRRIEILLVTDERRAL
jgi:chemotaxis protein MotB